MYIPPTKGIRFAIVMSTRGGSAIGIRQSIFNLSEANISFYILFRGEGRKKKVT